MYQLRMPTSEYKDVISALGPESFSKGWKPLLVDELLKDIPCIDPKDRLDVIRHVFDSNIIQGMDSDHQTNFARGALRHVKSPEGVKELSEHLMNSSNFASFKDSFKLELVKKYFEHSCTKYLDDVLKDKDRYSDKLTIAEQDALWEEDLSTTYLAVYEQTINTSQFNQLSEDQQYKFVASASHHAPDGSTQLSKFKLDLDSEFFKGWTEDTQFKHVFDKTTHGAYLSADLSSTQALEGRLPFFQHLQQHSIYSSWGDENKQEVVNTIASTLAQTLAIDENSSRFYPTPISLTQTHSLAMSLGQFSDDEISEQHEMTRSIILEKLKNHTISDLEISSSVKALIQLAPKFLEARQNDQAEFNFLENSSDEIPLPYRPITTAYVPN